MAVFIILPNTISSDQITEEVDIVVPEDQENEEDQTQ